MKKSRLSLKHIVVWALVIGLLATMGLAAAAGTAQAATRYKLSATGAGTVTTGTSHKLTVRYTKNGKPVKSAKVKLQYKKGSKWVTDKTVTVKNGKATVTVKSSKARNRTYRFYVKGKAKSTSQLVRFVPATFTISGSGSGHGVGMSQYGAYRSALDGKKVADILGYYYPSAKLGTANNNPRTVKVQILGPGSDSRTSTTLGFASGPGAKVFTVTDVATGNSQQTAPAARVEIGVSAGKVTARFVAAGGEQTTVAAARLRVNWDNQGIATVAGAQGTYKYGSFLISNLKNQPNVVNQLAMNTEYLYGIDEMPSSWGRTSQGMEALKAQVVVARNYVIAQAGKWKTSDSDYETANPACDCHVFDDPRSQNFKGATKSEGADNAPWVAAVNATIQGTQVNVLRTSSGGIDRALYFAASGEYQLGGKVYRGTAAEADAFGTAFPAISYHRHVDDPYSAKAAPASLKAWTAPLSQPRAATIFGLTGITRIAVTARYDGGLVKTLTATTTTGKTKSITRTAEGWRTALGLKGAWIKSIEPK
ncbi:MAG: SpoIID/LytB domain-containing protein [Propionicimonas sp.]